MYVSTGMKENKGVEKGDSSNSSEPVEMSIEGEQESTTKYQKDTDSIGEVH